MFQNTKNSKQQGDVGLGSAIAYFTQLGWTVSIPLTKSQSYDLIVDDGTGLKKVQVKTSGNVRKSDNKYEVLLKTCGGNQSFHTTKHFDPSAVQILFILLSNGDRYCIPTNNITNKSSLVICDKYKEYKIR